MQSGIYQIINTLNNHSYIGSSAKLSKRWTTHKRQLRQGKHHNIYLQRAVDKYGIDNFTFTILEQTDDLFAREQHWIDTLKPAYNLGSVGGGDNTSNHPNKVEISKRKSISQKARMENLTPEERQAMRERATGSNNPNWQGGKTFFTCPKCGKEHRITTKPKTCSNCRNRNGNLNPFFGKVHTKETKAKLRNHKLGIKPKNTKSITIDGITYLSQSDAAKALGISPALITYRIKKGIYTAMSN